MNPWVNVALSAISAIATTTVAIYVARISKRQWKTNAEKLRFDLYERRFQIYLRVLDFYQELIGWHDDPEQVARQQPFIAAFRESRFMFPPESGVYDLLKEFFNHSFFIVKHSETVQAMQGMSKEIAQLALKRADHAGWILNSISEIENKMAPYMNFHSV